MSELDVLRGREVLVVEDESLVCLLTEDVFSEAGCTVHIALRLAEGLRLAETAQLDLAVLDVNLGEGALSYPIASVLKERNIPFFFTTGYDVSAIDFTYGDHPVVEKPYMNKDLLLTAARILVKE